jgi:uncharacterized LabA/DUF88 family protein
MMFVDGENLTKRAQKIADEAAVELQEGPYYTRDVFVWLPDREATLSLLPSRYKIQPNAIRSYYYTTTRGAENQIKRIREALWEIGFQPEVFKKPRTREQAKGVDIALTKDLLSHAYNDNYDVAVLVAGDGDYVPLVTEVKRLGKLVFVVFFSTGELGLSPELRLASDTFFGLDDAFTSAWQSHL